MTVNVWQDEYHWIFHTEKSHFHPILTQLSFDSSQSNLSSFTGYFFSGLVRVGSAVKSDTESHTGGCLNDHNSLNQQQFYFLFMSI